MVWAHLLDKTMDKTKLRFDVQLLEQIERNDNDRVKLNLKVAKDLCRAVDASGDSLLHYAAKFGNDSITAYLIELGAKINVENEDGNTPLLLATKEQHASTIKILLKSDANIYICNKNNESAVQIALRTSPVDFKIAKLFLQRISNDCSSDNAEITEVLMKINCPLYVAVLLENVDVTSGMLSEGGSIYAEDPKSKKSALHVAVVNVDLGHVKKLLFFGADVNAKDASGKTPLALLSDFSKSNEALKIVETLLREKAKLTSCDNDGFMQMRSVIQNGTKDVVERLLQSSYDLTLEDQNKQNIVHYLASNCNPGIVELSFYHGYEHFSLRRFDLNARDKFGLTALHHAMNVGNKSFVKWLIRWGVNLHIFSNDGVSPLLQAVQSTIQSRLEQRLECIKFLLTNKAQHDIFLGNYFKLRDSDSDIDRDYALIEPSLAILAIWKAVERPFHQGILKKINSHPRLKRFFDACTVELEKMRSEMVYGNMSVLDLLAEYDDDECSRYSICFAFSGRWTKRAIRKYQSIPIYYEFLDKRVCEVMGGKQKDVYGFVNVVLLLIAFVGIIYLIFLSLEWAKIDLTPSQIEQLQREYCNHKLELQTRSK